MSASKNTLSKRLHMRRALALTTLAATCLIGLLVLGCSKDRVPPQAFATPDDAVHALTAALRVDDTNGLLAIVGSDGEDIVSSGDEVSDRQRRHKFLVMYDEKHSLASDAPDRKSLVIGNTEWPFPVPIVKAEKGWVFDAKAGREEILNRRIGENELSAIEVCKAIADAQCEYAMRDPDGSGVHEYAQKFASDTGKRNGLFWRVVEGEEPSPLGELAADAAAEGYSRKAEGPTPYHGYYYRILTAQGPNAPGGALDYLVNGRMTLGFAVIAHPADYGNSGIMSFMISADGVVYQKDLGEDTEKVAKAMKAFDPGEGWARVK